MPIIVITEHADGERMFARPEGNGIAVSHTPSDAYFLEEHSSVKLGEFAELCKSETDGDVVTVRAFREVEVDE